MFDTKIIGKKIAALRKAKDMTQMELADLMLVSYQAVSNWERGNTMPDISKLLELSQVLDISIEELLGSEKETAIVHKLLDQSEEIKLEEVAQVVELVKPSQVEEVINNADDEQYHVETLIALAPYLNPSHLERLIEKTKFDSLSQLLPLAPFLESAQLAGMLNRQHEMTGSFDNLVELAPFLDEEDVGNFAERIFNSERDAKHLVALAPFMSEKSLGKIARSMTEEQQEHHLVSLAPFIGRKDLTEIGRELMKSGKLKSLMQLLPFMDEDEL